MPLTALCANADGSVKLPAKIDQLITKIEMCGLYTEGLYRKSGVISKIKELKAKMSDMPVVGQPVEELDYDAYNVHVLANVLKSFLREMPEPLLSFDRYDDFLRASELSETADRVSTLLSLIKKLPTAHHALLERLVFHLALVAQREKENRMSASSLAIVFAPCVLRTSRQIPAQDSLNDIGRQTKCMETLITQKMLNVKSTLADIDTLDTAAHEASSRLTTIRRSKVFTQEEFHGSGNGATGSGSMAGGAQAGGTMAGGLSGSQQQLQQMQQMQQMQQQRGGLNAAESETEEMLLEDHIQEIKKEKAMLTSTLPSLARANSDDDLLSTDLDGEGGSLDDLSSKESGCGGHGHQQHHGQQHQQQQQLKDSADSLTHGDSMDGGANVNAASAGSLDLGDESPPAVSYNLRDQNVDYIQAQPQQAPSPPRRWTGSQQNLHYTTAAAASPATSSSSASSSAVAGLLAAAFSSNPTGGSELQRQKPLAVRSMSGGYESIGGGSGGGGGASVIGVSAVAGSAAASTSTIDMAAALRSRQNVHQQQQQQPPPKRQPPPQAKRQSSLDDEPIMV